MRRGIDDAETIEERHRVFGDPFEATCACLGKYVPNWLSTKLRGDLELTTTAPNRRVLQEERV